MYSCCVFYFQFWFDSYVFLTLYEITPQHLPVREVVITSVQCTRRGATLCKGTRGGRAGYAGYHLSDDLNELKLV